MTETPQMRTVVASLLRARQTSATEPLNAAQRPKEPKLLLQRAPLDARSLGLLEKSALRASQVSLADLLPRVQPDLRVLLYVCEPRRRLAKVWRQVPHRQPTATLASQRAAFERCASREPLSECAGRLHSAPLAEGIYGVWLRALLRALPASQLRVLRAEDFQLDPEGATREAFRFLQVMPDTAVEQWARVAAKQGAQTEKDDVAMQATLGEDAEALQHFYQEHAVELVQLMDGDERFSWPSKEPSTSS
eukprot:CAMPEP_0174710720 /NCGR_PEP_ID=MMETSP1094-20130205/12253_1 /TAXON_ID=156173 /ORGANISM="Chrysochromulina brevifilum, Strain UTEX LB 985" /LENGTH=248 /DNA_ID=CAMNT_0015909553 /DNA_START=83 /DNA_END=829 /DNA_ORIENTATION=+